MPTCCLQHPGRLLLTHPTLPAPACSFKPSQAHLQNATIEHLVETGKKTSLEHRRHVVDPTLLGLHEVRGRSRTCRLWLGGSLWFVACWLWLGCCCRICAYGLLVVARLQHSACCPVRTTCVVQQPH